MNYEAIVSHLDTQGYAVSLVTDIEKPELVIDIDIGGQNVTLVHFLIDEIKRLPQFFLKAPKQYDQLAHVAIIEQWDLGFICVNDRDSVSINYEQPHLAMEEGVKRHITIIEKAMLNPCWNASELLREFSANWRIIAPASGRELICSSLNGNMEDMEIYRPVAEAKSGFDALFLGISQSTEDLTELSYIRRQQRQNKRQKAIGKGMIIPLESLLPAPPTSSGTGEWYLNAIEHIAKPDEQMFNKFASWRDKEFWLIFNANTPSGLTWFGLHFVTEKKRLLPMTKQALKQWKVKPIRIKLFNKELVMPRSGALPSLTNKSVVLMGCGSVGGEIAHKLAAAGVGHLRLCDPDTFSIDNLYRHVLSSNWIGQQKTTALCIDLELKYPWIHIKNHPTELLDARNRAVLESYDLLVVAIGSPTHERLFHDFLMENEINISVINTWVEGYGVGGHATLDIPAAKGCLRCAYVDMDTLSRGLASNLNFFEPGQDLTTNHAGCGDLFLPYNAISACQTALVASDFAVKYLEGKIEESSKTSWKGDATDALETGFSLTHRYEVFNQSLQRLPLYNKYCDICNG